MSKGWNPDLDELEQTRQEMVRMQNSLAIEYDHTLAAELTKTRRFYILDCCQYRSRAQTPIVR